MLKRFALGACCLALVAGLLAGCSPVTTQNINDLLRAPALGQGRDEIQKALSDYLGGEAPQYIFPKEGDWRIPLLRADLDGDGIDEALLLYTVPESSALSREKGTNVYIALLVQDENGWSVVQEVQGLSTDVASVETADLLGSGEKQLIVGYSSSGLKNRKLALYIYENGQLEQQNQYAFDYSRYEIGDFTGRGGQDLVVVSSEEQSGSLRLHYVPTENGRFTGEAMPPVDLDSNFETCTGISPSLGEGGSRLIIVDGMTTGAMTSQILYYPDENGNFYKIDDSAALRGAASRVNPLLISRDVDGDGVVEIPRRVGSFEISTPAADKRLEYIEWVDFTGETPEQKWFGILDSDNEIFVHLPQEWQNNIKVVDGAAKGEWKVQNKNTLATLLSMRVINSGDVLPVNSVRVLGTSDKYLVISNSIPQEQRDEIQMLRMSS